MILTFNLEDGQKGYVRRRLDNGTYSIVAPVAEGNGVYQIMRPSDPTNPLAVISVMTDNGRPSVAANVLVNVATGAFKVLGTEYRDNPKYIAAWLPLERLAWIDDQGAAYTGSIQAQQSLNAPARMTDLWFVPSDRFLMRDDAGQFWTYERSGEMWYPALNPEENAKIDQRWFETAAVFEDGRHVFLFFQEYSAILDVDVGTVQIVTPFASPTEYYTVTAGTEGDIFVPPQQIKGTPFWFLQNEGVFRAIDHVTYLPRSTTIASTQIDYVSTGFVVDSRTGAVLGHEALGIPAELAIYDAYLSPDRTRLAVEVIASIESLQNNAPRVAQTWYYSFATGEPQLERAVEGAFAGWEGESAATLDTPPACEQREITIELGDSEEQ
ncbi:MAG: hypothetical protein KBG73_04565 [Candidatus Promineofilum sp.]|nr:hypothetical protein [Promineifilum sp.]